MGGINSVFFNWGGDLNLKVWNIWLVIGNGGSFL